MAKTKATKPKVPKNKPLPKKAKKAPPTREEFEQTIAALKAGGKASKFAQERFANIDVINAKIKDLRKAEKEEYNALKAHGLEIGACRFVNRLRKLDPVERRTFELAVETVNQALGYQPDLFDANPNETVLDARAEAREKLEQAEAGAEGAEEAPTATQQIVAAALAAPAPKPQAGVNSPTSAEDVARKRAAASVIVAPQVEAAVH